MVLIQFVFPCIFMPGNGSEADISLEWVPNEICCLHQCNALSLVEAEPTNAPRLIRLDVNNAFRNLISWNISRLLPSLD